MSTRYEVRIHYVDDTYWDEGSRWTSDYFRFDKPKDAIAFARSAFIKGCEVQGQCKKLHVRPKEDHIILTRYSETTVDWREKKEE